MPYPHDRFYDANMSPEARAGFEELQLKYAVDHFLKRLAEYNARYGFKSALTKAKKKSIRPYLSMLARAGWPVDCVNDIARSTAYSTKSLGEAVLKNGHADAVHIALHYIGEALRKDFDPDQARDDLGRWTSEGDNGDGSDDGDNENDWGSEGDADFDEDAAIRSLMDELSPHEYGDGNCAHNVTEAIRAGGIPVDPPPTERGADAPWAKDYGPSLVDAGFDPVARNDVGGVYPPLDYTPQKGDVVVIQSVPGHEAGHMAMYDGEQWISDFVQPNGIWSNRSYQKFGADYVIYRY